MKFVASIVAALAIGAVSCRVLPDGSEHASPGGLSTEALALLRPYLKELIAASNAEFDDRGVFLGASPHRRTADRLFDELLGSESRPGDEAIAYLLFIYTGEHPGEELICEAARRGKVMVPLIEQFSARLPKTGLEPYPKFVLGSGTLAPEALSRIASGERCEPYD